MKSTLEVVMAGGSIGLAVALFSVGSILGGLFFILCGLVILLFAAYGH